MRVITSAVSLAAVTNTGCAPGMRCGTITNEPVCVAGGGTGVMGEPCASETDCAAQFHCLGGHCQRYCYEEEQDRRCDDPLSRCMLVDARMPGYVPQSMFALCSIVCDPRYSAFCRQPCDPDHPSCTVGQCDPTQAFALETHRMSFCLPPTTP